MFDYTAIIPADVVKPTKSGTVNLREDNFNVKMNITLHGLDKHSQVLRFTGNNPLESAFRTGRGSQLEQGPVSLTRICDYLIFIKRKGKLCPVFIELGKTCPGSIPRASKMEQLFCSQVLVELYRPVHFFLLNGQIETVEPRFVLLYQGGKMDVNKSYLNSVYTSQSLPRVYMRDKTKHSGFETYYYGGRNKFIRVAKKIMDGEKSISADDIFNALPTPGIEHYEMQKLKAAYARNQPN